MNTFYCHCHYFSFRCFLVFLETVGLLLYQMTWVFITCFGESGQMEGSLIQQVEAAKQTCSLWTFSFNFFFSWMDQCPSKMLQHDMTWDGKKSDNWYATSKRHVCNVDTRWCIFIHSSFIFYFTLFYFFLCCYFYFCI